MVRRAPASLAAARLSEPDLPAPPMTATTGPGCVSAYCSTIRLVMAGAPQTSITARLSSLGRSSGMTAAIERPKRTAYPSAGTCSLLAVPAREAVLDDERGQGEGDEGGDAVADRRPRGDSGPTSSTVPTSMPPEPVSGFCILPRVATISSTSRRTASPSCVVLALELAERRGVEVETLDADAHLVGPQLLAGVEPLGCLRQRPPRRPGPGATRSDRWHARSFSFDHSIDRTISGLWLGQTGDRPPTVAQ